MAKGAFIFVWDRFTSWKTGEEYVDTQCGSSALLPIDGRWGGTRLHEEAVKKVKREKGCGYSVGYLNTHDPDNYHVQRVVKYREI